MIWRMWTAGLLLAAAAVWVAGQDDSVPPQDTQVPTSLDANGFPVTTSAPSTEPTSEPEEPLDANEPTSQASSGPYALTRPTSGPGAYVRPTRGGRSSGLDRSRFGRGSDRSRSVGGGPSPTARPTAQPTTGSSLQDYDVLVSRDIFLKDRRVRPPPDFPQGPIFQPPTPQESFILTGIGVLDSSLGQTSQVAAFFEDVSAGRLVRVTTGQMLDGGKIASISLDTVTYEKNGASRRIGIGGGLSGGGRLDLSTRPAVSDGGTASGASGGGDAEERMRRRRAEQLK